RRGHRGVDRPRRRDHRPVPHAGARRRVRAGRRLRPLYAHPRSDRSERVPSRGGDQRTVARGARRAQGRGRLMSANDRRIDYIEFAGGDIAATKAFYEQVFGWKFTDYGPEYTSFEDG